MPRILVLGKLENEIMPVAACMAGMSHFVTSAWDLASLADAVANGSPDIVLIFVHNNDGIISHAKDLIAHYDQVAEAPRIVIVETTDIPELQSKYFNDFILYPFENSELELRVNRLLNKYHKIKGGVLLSASGLVINTESFEVTVDSRQLILTFKEFELLRFLAAHPGRVHTREALLNQVWGYEYFGGLRTVDVHIRRIRAKLGSKHENLIQTVHGVGYKFLVSPD